MSTVERPPEGPATVLPLRADARRNLALILAAAHEVFLEQGVDGSVEEIARRAGVGVGTVYRRFPTKEDLIDAIIAEHFASLAVLMRTHLEAEDPWEGFCGMLRETLGLFAENRGFKAVVGGRFADGEHPPPMVLELLEISNEIVARAQASGDLRADFAPTDLPLIFTGAGAVMDATRDVNPRLWERYLTMVLDGLRASAATPLPVGPLTAEQQFLLTPPDRRGPGRC